MCLPDYLHQYREPGNRGILFTSHSGLEEKFSYHELYRSALKVLGALQERGVKPGDEVIIQSEDNKTFLIVFWGCLLGKIIPVPLSSSVRQETLLKLSGIWRVLKSPYLCADRDNARWIETSDKISGEEEMWAAILRRILSAEELLSADGEGAVAATGGEDLAYLQFSSGSTGNPKGVCLTHDNLVTNVSDIISSLGITENDVLLNWMPLTHDMGMIGFHLTGLIKGIDQVCIPTSSFIRRPSYWMETATSTRATVLYSPNFGLHYFLNAFRNLKDPFLDLDRIRILVNGAEPISITLARQFTSALRPFGLKENVIVAAYGLAEASVEVACTPPGADLRAFCLNRRMLKPGDKIGLLEADSREGLHFVEVGCPVSHCEVRICDDQGRPVPENTIGHIQIRGKNVTRGYYNDPEATTAVFTKDGWLKTGDLGFIHSGKLTVTGRARNMIVVNGQNYYPHDIERVIERAGIAELGKVAACGTSLHRKEKEEVLVFVVHKEDTESFVPIGRRIRETVLRELGIAPDKVIPIKRMPKTTSGKIRHYLLVERYLGGDYDGVLSPMAQAEDCPVEGSDGNNWEDCLIRIAKESLGFKDISASGNLFDAGMNSMMAIRFSERIKEVTGFPFPVDKLFGSPRIDEIAQYIRLQFHGSDGPGREKPDADKIPPAEPAHLHPLSPAQRVLWLLSILDPDASNYNESLVFEWKGDLDPTSLRDAFTAIVARHQALRVKIVEIDGAPWQVIGEVSESPVDISYMETDGSALPSIRRQISSFVGEPFQLDKGPLYRIALYKTGKNEHLLCIVMHHIITDEWSGKVLINEFNVLYDSFLKGLSGPLPPVRTRYIDYLHWMHGKVRDQDRQKERAFWKKEFQDVPPALNLPSCPNASGRYRDAGEIYFTIEKREVTGLRSLAHREKMSVFMLFLSALYILLSKYTGEEDITTGVAVAGRDHPLISDMPGFFVNTLPLRIRLRRDEPVMGLLQTVKRKCLEAFDHRRYFLDEIIADLDLERHAEQTPLFNVLVSYTDDRTAVYAHKGPGFEMHQAEFRIASSKYDLEFYFGETDDNIAGRIVYRSSLFTESRMKRMAIHFQQILNAVYGDPSAPVSAIGYLTHQERELLLNGFNNTSASNPANPVPDQFFHHVVKTPSATAVMFGDRALTYQELNGKADLVAGCLLQNFRVGKGDLVALMLDRSEYVVIGILGIWKAGATYVPLDPSMPAERLSTMLQQVNAGVIITSENCAHRCRSVIGSSDLPVTCVTVEDMLSSGVRMLPGAADIADLAYVMFTSGTSGVPKAVRIYHHAVANILCHLQTELGTGASDKLLAVSNYIFDISVAELFLPLVSGAALVIASDNDIRDARQLRSLFETHDPSVMQATPSLWNLLIGADWRGSARLKVITCGESLPDHLKTGLMQRAAEVWNMYGPTETTIFSTGVLIKDLAERVSIGRPVRNTRVFILDDHQLPVPVGVFGELYIAGLGLSGGYLADPALDEERFLAHICGEPGLTYRTGDIGRWLDNGCIELKGRSDDQVKLRGIRIEPGEIENSILSLDNVRSCVVVAGDNGKDGLFLVAYVVLRQQEPGWEENLRSGLSKKLPEYMIPAYIIDLPRLPLTFSGKADRKSLADRSIDKTMIKKDDYTAPRSEREQKMLEIWERMLERKGFGVTDSFFRCGGHSLSANILVNEIFREWGVEIKPAELFRHPDIRRLSELVETREKLSFRYIELE